MNERELKALQPKDKRYRPALGEGLYFQIQPTGKKSFQYRAGNSFRHLADFPQVTLKQARRLLRDVQVTQPAPKLADSDLFGTAAEKYIEKVLCDLAANTRKNNEARIRKWLLPKLAHRRFADITSDELLDVLRSVDQSSLVKRVKILYGQIARYSGQRDLTADLRDRLTPHQEKQHPAITDPRILAQCLRSMDSDAGHPPIAIGLRLTPLLALRPSEMRLGMWPEVDLMDAVWRIPESRMKMRRKTKGDHIVPLSSQAVDLLSELRRYHNGPVMFPGIRSKDRPISDATLNARLRQLGWPAEQVVCHGFRTTFSTLLNEQGVNPDWIEAQLAHTPSGVRAIYNNAMYLPQRREMMQQWGDYLDGLRRSVTPCR